MKEERVETNKIINERLALLGRKLKSLSMPSVKAILLFGSMARGELRERSDVDLLVLHEDCEIKDIVARRRWIYCLLREAIGDIFEDLTVIDTDLKDFLEPKEITPLLLNIYWDARVICDKTGKIEDFLKHVRNRIMECGLRRVKDGKAYYWILPEPLKEVKIL